MQMKYSYKLHKYQQIFMQKSAKNQHILWHKDFTLTVILLVNKIRHNVDSAADNIINSLQTSCIANGAKQQAHTLPKWATFGVFNYFRCKN